MRIAVETAELPLRPHQLPLADAECNYYITNSFLQKTIEIMREQEAILFGIIRFSTSAFFNRTDKKQGEKDE